MATSTKSRPFSALPATTQDARVRKAFEAGAIVTLKSGDPEEAAALTMALELPESELPAVAASLERIAASRREYEELCAVPLSQRTAKQNARIRTLGNRWENTAAGSGRAPGEPETEDTIVQIRGEDGEWTDYARTTRPEALAALEAGRLPGHSKPEPLRAVDWITKEEIQPAKAEPVSVVHDTARKRGQRGVTAKRVQPEEPDYSKLPASKRPAAKREYQEALAAWKAAEEKAAEAKITSETNALGQKFTALYHATTKAEQYSLHRAGCRDIEREQKVHDSNVETFEAASVEAALERMIDGELRELGYSTDDVKVHNCAKTKATARKPAAPKAPKADGSAGAFDPSDPATRAEVVRLHTEGKLSMKAIAEKFGLPAEHKSWLAVSLVWREEADARGLDRPRYPERSKK
jgi:hypothetical protein